MTVVNGAHVMQLDYQIYLVPRDEIPSGARLWGSAIETERELAELHGVSRSNARHADR